MIHQRPKFLKTAPHYLLRLPFVATSGDPRCPCEYNNGVHAAVMSLVTALDADEIQNALHWMKEARRQLHEAIIAIQKPGASIPIVGKEYDGEEDWANLTRAKPYDGPPCPHRCNLCSDHAERYATEHHWMLEYGDESAGTFQEEGFLVCRHCPAKRDLPIDDEDFLEAFNLG